MNNDYTKTQKLKVKIEIGRTAEILFNRSFYCYRIRSAATAY